MLQLLCKNYSDIFQPHLAGYAWVRGCWLYIIQLKLTFRQYPAIHTNYIISHFTTLQYNHNYKTRYLGRNEILNTNNNEINSAARLTWPANVDGRKLENSYVWKDCIIVASTCRRSVQFRCYITWLWMANCVSVMIKMLPLFNFTISCNGRRAWKTSRSACISRKPFLIDWIHSLLGTMSASAYIENLA